jgi:alkylation response protein AidB-like acyl-CoA dehydrogenase
MSTETIERAATLDGPAILRNVADLTPAIAARTEEIEDARRLPPDLVDQLRAAGCFRMLVPRRVGGAEATLSEHLGMIRLLSRADGSVGWTVMIGSSAPVIAAKLPAATFDAIYQSAGPDLVGAGSFNPKGVAVAVDGGYRATGRWPFASGCQHADWFIAHCMIDDGRMPPLRMVLVPATDVEIIDTWSVSGLCGTGSHDFTLDDVVVPAERSFSIFEDGSVLDGALGRIPELTFSALAMANVALGIAEGALAEVITLASAKVPMFAPAELAANPWFRHELGRASAILHAVDTVLAADVASAWARAEAGDEFSPDVLAGLRGTTTWATTAAAEVVDIAYTTGGGSALYRSSPLQRRLRDVRAVTQHFALKPDTFTLVGAVLAGQDVDISFL